VKPILLHGPASTDMETFCGSDETTRTDRSESFEHRIDACTRDLSAQNSASPEEGRKPATKTEGVESSEPALDASTDNVPGNDNPEAVEAEKTHCTPGASDAYGVGEHPGDCPVVAEAKKSTYRCFLCDRTFTQSSSLARHTLIHSGIRRYSCETCRKSFAQRGHLAVHRRTHTGERPYRCDVCGKAFVDSTHLARHRRVHTGDGKVFPCAVCGRAFRQLRTLNAHRRTHGRGGSNRCGKAFQTASGRKPVRLGGDAGVSEKTDGSPFSQVVGPPYSGGFQAVFHVSGGPKAFQTASSPGGAGRRRYPCDECGRSFSERRYLATHRRSHSGDRPFACDVCRKSFASPTNLAKHRRR